MISAMASHSHLSVADRLLRELRALDEEVERFLDGVEITSTDASHMMPQPRSQWAHYSPPQPRQRLMLHSFRPLDEAGRKLQAKLLKKYAAWFEHVQLLCHGAPQKTEEALATANRHVVDVIELKVDWVAPKTIDEAKTRYRKYREPFVRALSDLRADQVEMVIIPDTNALCACADWPQYAAIAGSETFSIVVLSTVLGELDKLKMDSRKTESFRDKAKKIITRIKGLRAQGTLSEGVTVNKTIRIRLNAIEPDFKLTLSHLDKDNADDRIIASVLSLQRQQPGAVFVLVTSDINLQNKAEAAKVAYAEPPESSPAKAPAEG
jgi:rRNA-processing protein FCF1